MTSKGTIHFKVTPKEIEFINWVAKQKGYKVGKFNKHNQRSIFLHGVVISYCRFYYKKYKEEQNAREKTTVLPQDKSP